MQRILIADDHSIVRKGLMIHCQNELGFSDVDEVANCSQLMKALKRKEYTHLILDLIMADGMTLEILPNIRALYRSLNIFVFTMQSKEIYGPATEAYGIKYFISKDAPEKESLRSLKEFLYNLKVPHPSQAELSRNNAFDKLTPRETEVLHYMLLGMGNAAIGRKLNIEASTISTFKRRIFDKTKTTTIFELKELAEIYKRKA